MSSYKEIVTKAVIGKGKKASEGEYILTTENIPNTILGCWVINHRFNGIRSNSGILINGSFDVNVWYSYDNDSKTAVSTKQFTYADNMNVRLKDNTTYNSDNEIIVESLKQPTVTDVKIVNGNVDLKIEKELGVQVVGETKMKIAIEEDEEPWEEIYEETTVDNEINEVNAEYLE